ncbi:hypothetical protein [Athalassotoga saccharophila]|uniref:Uncharacterized protein n=1 Tax=Athalassotoga saccharophila TaxID=1441386 RepID=A0A6N4TDL5_9BACT|nr:hypothetical protein [Athalassotoga saccharophila]BBJ29070.1 hypothetical protein ATHSA_p10023 [Athalassotoga saccharophila]
MEKTTFKSRDDFKIEEEIFQRSDHEVILIHDSAFNIENWEGFAIYLEDSNFETTLFNFSDKVKNRL